MLLEQHTRRVEQHHDCRRVAGHVEACPDCDDTVVDGQGLLYCAGCGWAGRAV